MRCTGKCWLLAATATLGVVEAGKTKSLMELGSARRMDCGLGLLDLILWHEKTETSRANRGCWQTTTRAFGFTRRPPHTHRPTSSLAGICEGCRACRHALSSDARSLRSPRTRVTPVRSSRAALSASAVARIRARTDCLAATSTRQISLPRVPVAPTTRFMLNAPDAHLSGWLDRRNVNQTRLRRKCLLY